MKLSWFSEKINLKLEIFAGLTNFMAIAYIIILNPLIMNANGSGFPLNATVGATVIVIVCMSIFAGVFVKLPFVIAPGMGFNTIIAYNLILQHHLSTSMALGVIFWANIIFLILILTGLQNKIVLAVPHFLQKALGVGLGCFLIFIGFKNAGIVVSSSNTFVTLGHMHADTIITALGFILTVVLFIKRKIYALLAPIIVLAIIAHFMGETSIPKHILSIPDFSLFLTANLSSSLKLSLFPVIISLFLVIYFDATTNVLGLTSQFDFPNENIEKKVINRSIFTESFGSIFANLMGTANGVIYVESGAGICQGAKTGISSIVAGALFVPFLFFSPLIHLIPIYATAPTMILVGCLMIHHGVFQIKFSHLEDGVAVFLTIIMMPLTFSITSGAVFGILSYTLLKLLLGKFKELRLELLIIACVCLGWFFV